MSDFDGDISAQLAQVQALHTNELMQLPHVIGVAVGMAQVAGETTAIPALVVLVDQKIPEDDLNPKDIIPKELEGIRVDVQEIGTVQAF